MRCIGFDCGRFRRPYDPLPEDEYQRYVAGLDGLYILTGADEKGVEG